LQKASTRVDTHYLDIWQPTLKAMQRRLRSW
jgi:hypothetical protein